MYLCIYLFIYLRMESVHSLGAYCYFLLSYVRAERFLYANAYDRRFLL